jgi:hypothetical protein
MRNGTDGDTKGRKIDWYIYRGCHQKELPVNFYIIRLLRRRDPGRPRRRWLGV